MYGRMWMRMRQQHQAQDRGEGDEEGCAQEEITLIFHFGANAPVIY